MVKQIMPIKPMTVKYMKSGLNPDNILSRIVAKMLLLGLVASSCNR